MAIGEGGPSRPDFSEDEFEGADIPSGEEVVLPFGDEGVDRHIIPDGNDASQGEPTVKAAPKEFPEEHRQAFHGLVYLGHLQDHFVFSGHEFTIKTLNEDDLLEVALLHTRWSQTVGANKAYQRAVVAASLVQVDSRRMPTPLGDEAQGDRFREAWGIVGKWYAPVTRHIFERYVALEREQDEVIKALGGASG